VILETANAWREVAAAREEQGAGAQAGAAALKAAELYRAFLDTFRPGGDAGGKPAGSQAEAGAALPDRIDAGDEAHAVRAAFHAGCMLNTAARLGACGGGVAAGGGAAVAAGGGGKGGAAAAAAPPPGTAQALLRWMAGYVKARGLTEFDQEAELAAELAALLDQREELMRGCAAATAPGGGGGRARGRAAAGRAP
jgi:hypothetical protein